MMTGAVGPNTYARQRREQRVRRTWVTLAIGALLLASFVLVTDRTGFPGPGPMRRYPISELQAVADRINRLDCSTLDPWPPPGASVDRLRSRVHLAHPESVVLSPTDRPMVDDAPPGPWTLSPTLTTGRCGSATVG